MPEFNVRMTQRQAADLAVVCGIGPERLSEVASLVEREPVTVNQKDLINRFERYLTHSEAEALSRVLLGLSSLSNREVEKTDDTLAGVTRTLRDSFRNDERFANWEVLKERVSRLLKTESVFYSSKALQIGYDFERVLTDSRIVTSIRPVFSADRSKIVGTTIVQTLRLEFICADGEQSSLSIAVDLDDMRSLLDACQRGLNKADVAKRTLEHTWGTKVVVPGEDTQSD